MKMKMKLKWQKAAKKIHWIGLAITIGAPLCAAWVELASLHGLKELRQQMQREGLPLTPAELRRPLPPPDLNAAPIYTRLTQLLKAKPLKGEDAVLNEIKRDVPSEVQNMQQVRFALPRRQDVVTLAHQAAQKPECNFDRDYSQGYNLLFPEYATTRVATRVLTNESMLLLFDGKPLDAIRNETLGFKMAQQGGSDPFLISKLVGISLNSITLRFMERVLYTAGDQVGVAQAVQNAVEAHWKPISMADGLRGEIVLAEVTFAQLRAGTVRDENTEPGETPKPVLPRPPSFVGTAMIDANELHLLQYQYKCAAAAYLPPLESQAKLNVLTEDAFKYGRLPTRMIATILIPVYTEARTKQAQGEAQKVVVCAAAAVMAYKRQHREWPETLEQAMPVVPKDPFSGQTVRYQREGKGFVVYSVGPTGKFDGGTASQRPNGNESVFRFPMPAYYTQAPTSNMRSSTPTP